ncbi:MAG: FRG domain-containing protein [Cellulomonadaceae bacterium]|nr:FRG domain-containing protein [Cellulomonadaceae bacterium]
MTPEEIDEFFTDVEIDESFDLVDAAASGFEALRLPEALNGWSKVKIVFRGQRDARWGITSSLARAVSNGNHSTLREEQLSAAETRILRAARGLDDPDGAQAWLGLHLTDGELLAVLQHQEAPTRFIDVTEDPLVALYFASDAEDAVDGRLFAIVIRDELSDATTNALDPQGSRLALDAQPGLPWPSVTTQRNAPGAWTNSLYYVDAGRLDPRMSAQRGLFIVGGLPRSYARFPLPAISAAGLPYVMSVGMGFRASLRRQNKINEYATAYAWSIRVPAGSKRGIRDRLKREHEIHNDSLFPEYREFKRLAQRLAVSG